jgi:sec-independent protein translocase protein TatA
MIGLAPLAWLTDPWTIGLVLIAALLLFGKRLPEVGRSLGRGIAEFKRGLHDVTDEMTREEPREDDRKQRLQPPADQPKPPPALEDKPPKEPKDDEPKNP